MLYTDTNSIEAPFLECLSFPCQQYPQDEPTLLVGNSRFEDWLPGTNTMLILTWEGSLTEFDEAHPLDKRLNRNIVTQLQLWDVDAYEVSLLVPQGIYGRFSPDGQYLAFHTYLDTSTNNEYDTQLHILRLADEQIILSLPSTETIIDFEKIPGSMWSPTSDRLIYQDKKDNWQIIQVPEGNQISITLNGGARLSFPQWSSDGQYLSLTVRSETERGIVILRIP
jgi:dipeptidyl aminopeptidase/acylaminoacyl peptidase